MSEMTRRRNSGFTLIELMITLVVLSILVAIAYPSYRARVIESRRTDAHVLLEKAAADEERFYTMYNLYTTKVVAPGCSTGQTCGLGYNTDQSPGGYYTLAVTAATGKTISNGFLLTAMPTTKGAQNSDGKCATITLDSTGRKGFTGTGPLSACW